MDKSAGEGYFLHGEILHGIAVDAYRRARDKDTDKTVTHNDSFVAIVFAAVSIEAFVNQIIVNDGFGRLFGRNDIVVLARILKLLAKKTSIATKHEIIHLILTGDACTQGEQPYQDFKVLIALRNWVTHMKPELFNAIDATRHLESRQVLNPKRENVTESQFGRIGTVAVARWACDTASDVTQAIANLFRPANDIRNQFFPVYFKGFGRIEDAD